MYRSDHILNKKKELSTEDSAMVEAGDEEDIVDRELMNWENLNLENFEDDYSNEEERTDMLKSFP